MKENEKKNKSIYICFQYIRHKTLKPLSKLNRKCRLLVSPINMEIPPILKRSSTYPS